MTSDSAAAWPADARQFGETQWSVVLRAAGDDTRAHEALTRLCQTYWYPLYAFVRRQGHRPEDAQDLTQGFFAHLLENHALAAVDQAKGTFRSFLLASLRNFLANEWDRAQTQKRGHGRAPLSLDALSAETRYGAEPADHASPDRAFELNWALTLLEHVLARLRSEQTLAGKAAQFEQLQATLMADPDAPAYASLAAQLGLSENALRMTVHRLRRRYRELLRQEIAQTVSSPTEVEDELSHLFEVLAR